MSLRLGLGPVFKFECLIAARRWQHFAGRSLFIAFLLLALLWVVWRTEAWVPGRIGIREMASVGEKFYLALTVVQLSLLFLIPPAVAADAICLDKAKGALLPLLTTDLSNSEIVLGKLFARYLPIFGFVLCGLPVLAICFSMGGIHPEIAFGSFLVCLGVALVGGALALTLSVWCTKVYEVLLISYLAWIVFLLLLPIATAIPAGPILFGLHSTTLHDWARFSNPVYLCLAPYLDPGSVGTSDLVYFFIACLSLSVLLIAFAISSVRAAVLRQGMSRRRKARRNVSLPFSPHRWFPGPSLDVNPVLWREWHRRHPSRWIRAVWITYILLGLGFSIFAFLTNLADSGFSELAPFVTAFLVSIGLLLVSITSVTSLQEERTRGSLDVLLTTPLSSRTIYWGKWWASFRTVILLSFLPTVVAAAQFVRTGWHTLTGASDGFIPSLHFLFMPIFTVCYGACFVSVGLAMALWIKRTGRAVACSLILYVMVTVGLMLGIILEGRESYTCLGSSFMASGFVTAMCHPFHGFNGNFVLGLTTWCLAYALVGAIIAGLSYLWLDRSLGRMPEQ